MARKTRGRAIDGVVLVDKPTGASSNRILQQVKRIFYAQKAGHTGALDPLATGMLPICLGEATKFAQFLLDADKSYRVVAEFGVRTNTSDADGEVVATAAVNFTRADFERIMVDFTGPIQQVPSMFSALKHQGKPLYDYARKGIEVPREARPIHIYKLDIVSFDLPFVTLDVTCSKGTYIRSLVDDMGQALGAGAYVKELRRTGVADYAYDDMYTIAELDALIAQRNEPEQFDYSALDQCLLPTDSPVTRLPKITVSDTDGDRFLHGQPLKIGELQQGDLIRVWDTQRFLGVAQLRDDGLYWPKRVLSLP
ncbi:tRNA pseudouridine(55) synthase TruB [Aliidiomarina halalkaliphila]|uniref:tRNA pseudouridine synthase B n=1 Tax=Aliidiomarina halalkaliphila TaxID=2593535 RepID=A0A552X2Y5_9GAMM|nr:tRNA pseudouridine(55) synthase TruB [Aliidiomarina halalkaliphila]TRW49400.1 tRNA pseudouridine(55) synthase TruB [Aliidiomarina halalkaliphila]